MPRFDEHALELSIMELFQQEGYTYTNGEEVHKEVSDVLLRDDRRHYVAGDRACTLNADRQRGLLFV